MFRGHLHTVKFVIIGEWILLRQFWRTIVIVGFAFDRFFVRLCDRIVWRCRFISRSNIFGRTRLRTQTAVLERLKRLLAIRRAV